MQRLIDAESLKELFPDNGEGSWTYNATAKAYIDAQPTIQPERKTGHWIAITSRNNTYKCSVCGRLLVNVSDGKNNVSKHYPYCHCGAKMEGGEQE